jgi:hypothetical protein
MLRRRDIVREKRSLSRGQAVPSSLSNGPHKGPPGEWRTKENLCRDLAVLVRPPDLVTHLLRTMHGSNLQWKGAIDREVASSCSHSD